MVDSLVKKLDTFLFVSNVVVFVLVPLDFAYIAGILQLPSDYLTLVNLIGVAVTMIAFRYKRKIRLSKEAKVVKPASKSESS